MKKFISVSVLRSSTLGDGTNNGLSSKADTIYIEHPRGWISEKHAPEALRVDLIKRNMFGTTLLSIKPSNLEGHSMAGGNFAWSNDARFTEMSNQPIAIHDRVESKEEYKHYSS